MSHSRVDNESVINELTAGLAQGLKTKDESSASGDSSTKTEAKDIPETDSTDMSHFADTTSKSKKTGIEKEYDEDHSDKSDDDDNYIDEEALKDAEVTLSEDQKAELKIISDALKNAGNDAYKRGEFELSIEKYTDGLRQCPLAYSSERAVLYCNRSAAKMKMEKYKKAIHDCNKSIQYDDKYIKAYWRRAQCYEQTEKLDEALQDFKRILELDPSHSEASRGVARLPSLIEERNEKLKTEMLGKLKDLGNMILKPFGLSTDNFQVNQDPTSKGYSINFKK